jgi:intracellular multiplication protein IcmW
MPDLSLAASREFWNEYHDKMIYRVIAFMESVEKETLDGDPSLEAAIAKLGEALDEISSLDLSTIGHEPGFIELGCHIKSSRCLRLLQAIDSGQPGAASKVLIYAEENTRSTEDAAGYFLRRNIVFERLRLLGRIFAPDRLALVLKTIEGEDHA